MSEGYVTDGTKTYKVSDVEAYLEKYPNLSKVERESTTATSKPKTTMAEAAGLGLARGMSLGLSDESEGFLNWLGSKTGGTPRTSVRGVNAPIMGLGDYIGEASKKYTQAEKDRPITFNTADIFGSIPMAIATGGNVKKGTPPIHPRMLTRVANVAKRSVPTVGLGAVEGAARTEGGVGDRAIGAAIGGATMAALPVAVKALASRPIGRAALGAGVGYVAGKTMADVVPFGEDRDDSDWEAAGASLGALVGISPKLALKLYLKVKTANKSAGVKDSLEKFLDLSPKGKVLRADAREGNESAQKALIEVRDRLNNIFEKEDSVMAYAHTGLKKEYVQSAMATDWVDVVAAPELAKTQAEKNAYREAEGYFDKLRRKNAFHERYGTPTSLKETAATAPQSPTGRRKINRTEDQVQGTREFEVTGEAKTYSQSFKQRNDLAKQNLTEAYSSVQELSKKVEKFAQTLVDDKMFVGRKLLADAQKLVKTYDPKNIENTTIGSDLKTEAFMDFDKLKKRLWSVAKSLDNSSDSNAGAAAQEAWSVGTDVQKNLENSKIWGSGSAKLQKEINSVWHPWLTARKPSPGEKGFRRFESYMGAEPSKRIGRTRPEVNTPELKSMIEGLGTTENDLKEKIFNKGITTSVDLSEGLADKYAGGDILKKLESIQGGKLEDVFDPEALKMVHSKYMIKPDVIEMAYKVRPEVEAIKRTLSETTPKLGAYRELQGLESIKGPLKPSTVIGMLGLSDVISSNPVVKKGIEYSASIRDILSRNPSNVGLVNKLTNKENESNNKDPRIEAIERVNSFKRNTTKPKIKIH